MKIVRMKNEHREEVKGMMTVFYSSPAVDSNGSPEIFDRDIDACVGNTRDLKGYVFLENGKVAGYSMVSGGFSTEFGRKCLWIEDLYFKPEFRDRGLAGQFFSYIGKKYRGYEFKLEVEKENERAVHVYRREGFSFLPYEIMIKGYDDD